MSKREEFAHIVITGASSGIGEALARHYARPGLRLSLSGRNAERLALVEDSCRALGAEVQAEILCVTDREGMRRWLERCDTERPIDLVIANAGISAGTGGVLQGEDPQQARHVFDVNLTGVLNTVEPVLPRMQARGRGHIALMSSLAGFRGWPGAPSYCASKAAVKVYGEGLRGAVAKTGVKLHVICPGFVHSRMTAVNNFPMPFIISAEKAAKIIAAGIARNKGRIAFPLPVHFFAWAFSVMPDFCAQMILAKTPAKSPQPQPQVEERLTKIR